MASSVVDTVRRVRSLTSTRENSCPLLVHFRRVRAYFILTISVRATPRTGRIRAFRRINVYSNYYCGNAVFISEFDYAYFRTGRKGIRREFRTNPEIYFGKNYFTTRPQYSTRPAERHRRRYFVRVILFPYSAECLIRPTFSVETAVIT